MKYAGTILLMDGNYSSSATNNRSISPVKLGILAGWVYSGIVLAFCLLGWLAATVKQHLHLPLSFKEGKTEYLSMLANQNSLDLFGHAQEHDKAGETELATIDYKAGVASSSFKTLPAKLKAILIELSDCRDALCQSDYFDELITHSHVGYWSQTQMPLRVYVPDETHADGFSKFDRQEIDKCYAKWCALVPGRLSYKFIDEPEHADIVFSQKDHAVELSFSRSVMAHTIPQPAGPEKWCVFPASKATVEPLRLYPEIVDYKDPRAVLRHTIFLHEIGHSLGIIGHSAHAGDLMFFSGTTELSERDKATFRRIYAPGSIYERAEKALRARAAANDKYALLQLAGQLDECGTASQTQLKMIYQLSKRAAELGSSRAKLMLGWMYHDGNGCKRDLGLASKYFHESSSEGNPGALLALSTIYEKGDGVVQDLETAEKYLKLALRVDLARAPVAYGNFLTYQYGDKSSQERAAAFYKNGCKIDQLESMLRLALLYEHGEGVKKDLHQAAELRTKARQQVLRLQARDAADYFARACALGEIYETKKAIKDFSEALRLKPDFRAGYLARGSAWQAVGNNEAACLDMTKALELDPDCVQAYLGRAYSNLGRGKAASALLDVDSMLSRSKSPDSDRLYGLIVGSLACRLLHDEADSKKMLDQAASASAEKSWPGPIIRFLNHQISETEFSKEALGYSRATEVRFYMAMDQSLSGKVEDAINNLQWVKDNGDRTFYEYPVAIAQLERLQKSRRAE